MRSLSDTLARLSKMRRMPGADAKFVENRLSDLGRFGTNPGALAAKIYIPDDLKPNAALVVVLHGCTQTAASYDTASGWSRLADDYGFALLFPEQVRANNSNNCFNWFVAADIGRDEGEALSISQMIDTTVVQHSIDRQRVFITGLSAGGAMANVMLATYPELFAGGAIIAGLPYGAANSVPEAFDRMRGHGLPATAQTQEKLRSASAHAGPWPTISIWHGTKDATVVHDNARVLVEQWRGVHGVDEKPDRIEEIDGHTRQSWSDGKGQNSIELYSISGMAHGTPLDVSSGYGQSAPFMLDVGISSTLHIARSWGLTPSFERKASRPAASSPSPTRPKLIDIPAEKPAVASGIQKTIEDALKAAGLMK